MKKNILVAILVITGIVFILYPFISNFIDKFDNTELITDYDNNISMLTKEQKEEKIRDAEKYNNELEKDIHIDVSLEEKEQDNSLNYSKLLDVGETMGYISIPKIDVNLPIYHGTSSEILKKRSRAFRVIISSSRWKRDTFSACGTYRTC